MRPTVIDLFSGAGGLSEGFKQAGFIILAAYDNDSVAVEHFNRNVADVAVTADLSKVGSEELLDSEGIIGGPPCQGFSLAGKRDISDPRSRLVLKFAEFVSERQPKFFVMENVHGLQSMEMSEEVISIFEEAGFDTKRFLLNANDYGVAQIRKRLFFIGVNKERDGEKMLAIREFLEENKQPERTVKEVLPEYPYECYYRHPFSYGRRAIYSVNEPSATIRTVNRPMPKTYKLHKNDFVPIDGRVRALTEKERAIIQSFPPGFKWNATKTKLNELIGNAVPPLLAKAVGEAVYSAVFAGSVRAHQKTLGGSYQASCGR
jgi:DNA (cytosine-5)-methyltransferase 1